MKESILTSDEMNKYNLAHEAVVLFFKNPKKNCLEKQAIQFNKKMDDLYPGWVRYAEPKKKKIVVN